MKLKLFLFILFAYLFTSDLFSQGIDLSKEYSMDEFKKGINAYHKGEYDLAISFFTKSLSYKSDNHIANYFLGETFRKAGYEKNAIFTWNNLLAMGFNDKMLKSKISNLYNEHGLLSQININKNFLIKEDIKGYIDDKSPALFIKPAQITTDRNNHYFFPCFLSGYIVEMDQNFHIVKNHFPLGYKLEKPFGVAVDSEENIYVSDFQNDVVIKFDKFGLIKSKIGYKGIGQGALLGPEFLLLDDDNNLYISDTGNSRINKYNNSGDFLFSIGDEKNDLGEIKKPAGIYYSNNQLFVCDKEANKIIIYDKNGNFLYSLGENILNKPYQLTIDQYNRFLIICETEVWVYEKQNDLWYIFDAVGNRLNKGISIINDRENNILLTDFNTSRLIVLTGERDRYTNLNVNIERIYSNKFPDVIMSLTVKKDDFSLPTGITPYNLSVYENGKLINGIGMSLTEQLNNINDVMIIYDNNYSMDVFKKDIKVLIDAWFSSKEINTNFALISLSENDAIIENNFGSSWLTIKDSINNIKLKENTDIGSGIKLGISNLLSRFSKKTIIIITNSKETGNSFNQFKIENCIDMAKNNNIPVYVLTFSQGGLSQIFEFISKKTGASYYNIYKNKEVHTLIKTIEQMKSNELIFSYKSRTISRFGEEPISIIVEVDYSGMKGFAKSIYYPITK
ncbi:MAG: hypothetical protein JXB50_10100 [Spirochaetes bacterium]|nr:hypothetical protein [Spirochaetota bacterium]